jgi:hypothetical protein
MSGGVGRHARGTGRAGGYRGGQEPLRKACLTALVLLILEYAIGIFLNLYVAIPQHAGLLGGPFALTVHVTLGMALVAVSIVVLSRAIGTEDQTQILLAASGLTAIAGAFTAGEIFVHNNRADASLFMALLGGAAILAYVGILAQVSLPLPEAKRQRLPRPARDQVEHTLLEPLDDPPPEWLDALDDLDDPEPWMDDVPGEYPVRWPDY